MMLKKLVTPRSHPFASPKFLGPRPCLSKALPMPQSHMLMSELAAPPEAPQMSPVDITSVLVRSDESSAKPPVIFAHPRTIEEPNLPSAWPILTNAFLIT